MSEKKTVDLGLLEEDDEFEEFPAEGKLPSMICVCALIFMEWLNSGRVNSDSADLLMFVSIPAIIQTKRNESCQ